MDMSLFHNLAIGFGVAMTPVNLFYCLVGVLLGTLIGVLPGIGPVATIAMLSVSHIRYEPVAFSTVFSSMASNNRPPPVIQEATKGQNHGPGFSTLSGLGSRSNSISPENIRTSFLFFLVCFFPLTSTANP